MRCLSSRNSLKLRAVCQGVKEVPVSSSGVSMGRKGCLKEAGAVGHGRLRRVDCVLQAVGATEGLRVGGTQAALRESWLWGEEGEVGGEQGRGGKL